MISLTSLNAEIVRYDQLEQRRRARHAASVGDPGDTRGEHSRAALTMRFGAACDDRALKDLADLDSARVPTAPLLVAELAGRVVAALSLADGSAIADPFTPTAEILVLLRVRATQLADTRRQRSVASRFALRRGMARLGVRARRFTPAPSRMGE